MKITKKEIRLIILKEIDWCIKHQKDFQITSYGLKWFIKGMRQAVYIITKLK